MESYVHNDELERSRTDGREVSVFTEPLQRAFRFPVMPPGATSTGCKYFVIPR